MSEILILKVGALGDVLRTTSILPGLARRYPGSKLHWVTAHAARSLVENHPLVARTWPVDAQDSQALEALGDQLALLEFERVIALDDEPQLCQLATRVGQPEARPGVLSGAYLCSTGARVYTPDVGAWFDMGLLSVHGKQEADRRKLVNHKSHALLYAQMLGIEMGEPQLPLTAAAEAFGRAFAQRHALGTRRPLIGFNTGSGGRWESKKLPVERTLGLAVELARRLGGTTSFVILGGSDERERNCAIVAGMAAAGLAARCIDAGTDNAMLDFAAIVDQLDLLVTSDSLALHIATARRLPVLAFFAPTSAAEIELYGRGEKLWSTAPDYCSYRADADNSSLTVERLSKAALRVLQSVANDGSRS